MSDQLEDLKRQRALVADHLAWLDRLIAAKSNRAQPGNPPAPTAPQATGAPADALVGGVGSSAPEVPPTSPATEPHGEDADALFARFAAEERPALHPPSKLGCWLGFSLILLGAVGGVIAIIYRAYR